MWVGVSFLTVQTFLVFFSAVTAVFHHNKVSFRTFAFGMGKDDPDNKYVPSYGPVGLGFACTLIVIMVLGSVIAALILCKFACGEVTEEEARSDEARVRIMNLFVFCPRGGGHGHHKSRSSRDRQSSVSICSLSTRTVLVELVLSPHIDHQYLIGVCIIMLSSLFSDRRATNATSLWFW